MTKVVLCLTSERENLYIPMIKRIPTFRPYMAYVITRILLIQARMDVLSIKVN